MSFMPAWRAMSPAAWAWTPTALGSALFAWWDTRRPDLITQSGGSVSSWKDIVSGLDATQGVGAAKPTYGATSFNGGPGISFDGTDDTLETIGIGPIPGGAGATDVWLLLDQAALVDDTAIRVSLSWGDSAANSRRDIRRYVSGGNRANTYVGDGGAGGANTTNTTVDFSGRHVQRAIITATSVQQDVDGVAGSPTAVVPATGTTRLRLGANSANTAGSPGNVIISAALITGPLTDAQAAQLYAYLNRRL
jgi:hypothetical protein